MSAIRGRPRDPRADQAITDAALELLSAHGFSALGMAEVAERAGVSTATLYRRFASREELAASAVATLVPDRPPVDTGSLAGDIRETLRRMAEILGSERGRLLFSVSGETAYYPRLADAMNERFDGPFREDLTAMLERAVARGELDPVHELDLAISLILGPLQYLLARSAAGIPRKRVLDALMAMILRGLGAR